MRRTAWSLLGIVLVTLLAPSGAGAAGTYDRLYLLAAPNGSRVWTPDASEPTAQEPQVVFGCEVGPDGISTVPCSSVQRGSAGYAFGFSPGARLATALSWGAADAPTFHVELSVDVTGTYAVTGYVSAGGGYYESTAAAEVSPGVFDGRLPSGIVIDPATATGLGVIVRATGHLRGYTLKTGGASYVHFTAPFEAKTFADLVAESTYAPAPSAFSSADHWFTFNDDNWTVIPFDGNTSTLEEIPFTIGEETPAVYAYIDDWSSPFVHRAIRRQQPDARTLLTNPILNVLSDGHLEARGPRSVATPALPAGDYVLRIERLATEQGSAPLDIPYQGYLVIVRGERTLASMRFRFPPSSVLQITSPVAYNFPPSTESIVVPRETTTMLFDLTVDSVNPQPRKWAVVYGIYGYGSGSASDGTRIIARGPASGRLTASPWRNQPGLSVQDVMFDLTLGYTYTSP